MAHLRPLAHRLLHPLDQSLRLVLGVAQQQLDEVRVQEGMDGVHPGRGIFGEDRKARFVAQAVAVLRGEGDLRQGLAQGVNQLARDLRGEGLAVQHRLAADVVEDGAVGADRHARHAGGLREAPDGTGRARRDEGEDQAGVLGGADRRPGPERNRPVAAQQGPIQVAGDEADRRHGPA